LAFEGAERALLRAHVLGAFVGVTSDYVLVQVRRVSVDKLARALEDVDRALAEFAFVVVDEGDRALLAETRTLLRDPTDAPVLAAALAAGVDGLVTGDKDLHTAPVKARLRVFTTREALEWIEAER
jgi:predicted nucleic acid-binding protein